MNALGYMWKHIDLSRWPVMKLFSFLATTMISILVACPLYAFMNSSVAEGLMGDEACLHDYVSDRQQTPVQSMTQMSDEELSEVTAAGFSSFTLEDGVARALFNLEVSTFTEIDSLKMGYYLKDGETKWDEDWTNVSLGSAEEDLVCKGVFIEASFTNITQSNRTLDSIRIGTPDMTGDITATFNSFTGAIYNNYGTTLVLEGQRDDLGTRTITSTNSEFYVQLSSSGDHSGWWFYWGNATISDPLP